MTQPPGKTSVPLVVAAMVATLLVLGAGAFFLLRTPSATPVAGAVTSSPAARSTSSVPTPVTAQAPTSSTHSPGPPAPTGSGASEKSGDVARAWVAAMADGEWQRAFDLSCPEVQDAATTAAAESHDPPYELGAYFFTRTLGGSRFTDATFDGVEHSPASGTDVATFTLALDTGEPYRLHVYVDRSMTVCDFR